MNAKDYANVTRACFAWSICGVLLALCAGCSGEEPAPVAAAPAAAPDATADVYIVRGEVATLPPPERPTRGFYVHHEAIDDFRGSDGTIVGMDAMTMLFPLDDPALLEGLAVGDKVELTYEVNWHGEPMQRVTALRRLPADTELVFRNAHPPNATEPAGETPNQP